MTASDMAGAIAIIALSVIAVAAVMIGAEWKTLKSVGLSGWIVFVVVLMGVGLFLLAMALPKLELR